MKQALGLALLFCALAAGASPATDAIRLQEQRKLHDWHYRVSESGDQQRVALHDASKPEDQRWLLESVAGRPATATEQAEFLAMHNKARKSGKRALLEMIDEASLTPIDGNPASRQWKFAIKPDSVDMVSSDKLRGELTLTADGQVASIDIRNPEPFRVMLVEKVEKVILHQDYARQPSGIMLPAKSTVEVLATGPQDIRQHSIKQYSDYKAGEASAAR
ncbi:hypothetical protein [Chitinimonas sp.]|uniref:hypothetical protein n=1 Tax=Chitinimonas sp. TaxID=1934313 RepID=UPI0035AF4695